MLDHIKEWHPDAYPDAQFMATYEVSLDERIRLKVEKGQLTKASKKGSSGNGDDNSSQPSTSKGKRKQRSEDTGTGTDGKGNKKQCQ